MVGFGYIRCRVRRMATVLRMGVGLYSRERTNAEGKKSTAEKKNLRATAGGRRRSAKIKSPENFDS